MNYILRYIINVKHNIHISHIENFPILKVGFSAIGTILASNEEDGCLVLKPPFCLAPNT